MIVVDSNVVSELMRTRPDASVRRWALSQPGPEVHTTSITVAEILYGIERLDDGSRKSSLRAAATEVFAAFADQVLAFDQTAAVAYATIVDARDRHGRPIDGFDAQIAAICRTTGASLATRNLHDFEHTGVELIDPWQFD